MIIARTWVVAAVAAVAFAGTLRMRRRASTRRADKS